MTTIELRGAPPGGAVAWWRAREHSAGPAGAVTIRLSQTVIVRLDRADPTVLLDLEGIAVAADLEPRVRALAAALWGSDVAATAGEIASVEDSGENPLRSSLLELVGLAAVVEGSLPALCSIDVARHADLVAGQCTDADLRALVRSFGTMHAARAAHAWDQLPSSDALDLNPAQAALLADIGRWIDAQIGGERGAFTAPFPQQAVPTNTTLDWLLRGDQVGVRRGRGSRQHPVTLDGEHLGFVVSDCVLEQRNEIATITGGWQPPDGSASPPPVAWVRAFTPTGALIYASRCDFSADTFAAELVVAGEIDEGFVLDLTTDLMADPWSGAGGNANRARTLAAAAANLQTTAVDSEEWSVVGALWERSATLWGAAGDQARRTLALVHGLRAYRAAGPRYAVRMESLEHAATLALTRLDPRWSPPDPTTAASADPRHLQRLLATSELAPAIDQWVRQQLEGITATVRESADANSDHRDLVRRIEVLERATAAAGVGPARMNARVALARWAARAGRRRMALLVLYPLVIRYDELDTVGRREFAETQALLIGPVSEPDPDDPDDGGTT
ncbi:hypothetical protein [Nocardioides sp. W7]|uniref:hypothetical protein n=1 Tax=Nocardioides sp. W7 TaxID=2931390 RepID=UPI001FD5EC90|nr:hypothetical protein [Nocardioides sp. W7]